MAQTEKDPKAYKKTLNLPRTAFPMKANLVQNEPASQKRWDKLGVYQKLRQQNHPAGPFVFHDGPPYANGDIHLGHLLNKVLKDFVVRTKTMAGYDVPYVPGWDCHGLPIEHKVLQDLGPKAKDMDALAIRRQCKKAAEKFQKRQATQMQRLLTVADYDDPYLTMNPGYESAVLEVFAKMIGRGVVYRGLKPVHWSIDNQTALAEAELEYHDREDTAVFVRFEIAHTTPADTAEIDRLGLDGVMIWTTTPWTLPANRAVAVHPEFTYGIYDVAGHKTAIAVDLAPSVFAKENQDAPEPLATIRGSDLVGLTYTHPFLDDGIARPIVPADYVTLEDGTGLVHTAPGHGTEDYQTGLREGLDIYCPARADGTFDDTAPDWLQGKSVWDANPLVVDRLRDSGHLFHAEQFTHSYPHDWRSKTPVIFRATAQWFVDVNKKMGAAPGIRELALAVTGDDAMTFYPAWGRNRMRGMLDTRPDWCLSRQRAWGLPIPAFYHADHEDQPLLTPASVRAVAKVIGEKGSDAWFVAPPEDLLKHYDPADDEDAPQWVKEAHGWPAVGLAKSTDIFDVWFESGSSWAAVLQRRGLARTDEQNAGEPSGETSGEPSGGAHADLYLEGSDQHRGWFQLSLLASLAATGKPPFRGLLTHGFMVDREGRKMSKSQGNALGVKDLMKQHGADVCRWWVASIPTDNDIKVDEEFFRLAGESYRKVRNTIRFLLSNLSDFDPGRHAHDFTDADASSIDAWALGELDRVIDNVTRAYEGYDFRRAHETLFNFCNETLSATYLAAVKDRLYCDVADAPPEASRRRRSQTAIHTIASALTRLLAPLLPHTADEAWRVLTDDPAACVHLDAFPEPTDVAVSEAWDDVFALRDTWLKEIEAYRQAHDIDNPMDLGLRWKLDEKLRGFLRSDLADLCGISRFEDADTERTVIDLGDAPRCDRCWQRTASVADRSDGGALCDRCAAALGL